MINFFALLLFVFGCSEDNNSSPETDFYIKLKDASKSILNVSYNESSFAVEFETNVINDLYSGLTLSIEGNESKWCEASLNKVNNTLLIKVDMNHNDKPREAQVIVGGEGESLKIQIVQHEYVSSHLISPLKKVDILSGSSPDFLSDNNMIEKAFDSNPATFFNAKAGEANFPYEVKFVLDGTHDLSQMIYYPRADNGTRWGQFGEVEVWCRSANDSEPVFAGRFDFKKELDHPSTAPFENLITGVHEITVKVFSGYKNRVSIGEIEFYSPSDGAFDCSSIFKDKACSILKDGVTLEDIKKIDEPFFKHLASRIFDNSYDSQYRVQSYRPFQHPSFAANELKTSKYSLRDNATGIYYNNLEENLIVFVDDLNGQKVSLNLVDFQASANEGVTFPLSEGINILKPLQKGLIYIYYHVDKALPLNPESQSDLNEIQKMVVRIHIATGVVNGLFDIRKNTEEDWPAIRDNAIANEIDVLGLHSHVVWSVKDYREYNTKIVTMTNYVDNLVKQQHEFMGLYHHNHLFKNRQFLRVDYHVAAAYASDYKTVYKNSMYKEVFCSEDGFKRRLWVLGHEIGHTNQTRPGIKWHGTTEVTNNLFALYNQRQVHGEARRLENGDSKQGFCINDGYDAAFDNIIKAKSDWYLGGESFSSNFIPRLTPFWQLYLYLVQIEKQEHFYHDLFEHYRNSTEIMDDGLRQLDFVRNVCLISQTNLLDFFSNWGFLTPIDLVINDYGTRNITITLDQINNLKNEINSKGFRVPDLKVHELRETNYKQYMK